MNLGFGKYSSKFLNKWKNIYEKVYYYFTLSLLDIV